MFKIIAFSLMIIDHLGFIFFPDLIILRIIGRLSFPIFAFGVAYGYSHSRDVFKYGQRLLLLALLSQPVFYLLFNSGQLNIVFTLFLGLLALYLYDRPKKIFFKIIGPLLVAFIANYLSVEYGAYGVLMILFFFIFKNSFYLLPVQSLLTFFQVLAHPASILQLFSIPAFFLVHYFQKFDFKINRTFQYLFYPLHLLLLYLVRLWLF